MYVLRITVSIELQDTILVHLFFVLNSSLTTTTTTTTTTTKDVVIPEERSRDAFVDVICDPSRNLLSLLPLPRNARRHQLIWISGWGLVQLVIDIVCLGSLALRHVNPRKILSTPCGNVDPALLDGEYVRALLSCIQYVCNYMTYRLGAEKRIFYSWATTL